MRPSHIAKDRPMVSRRGKTKGGSLPGSPAFREPDRELSRAGAGWQLYEMFFKNHTCKHWRRNPKDVGASVCGRVPICINRDDRYISEKFQALPEGYTTMFVRILDHPKIQLRLNTHFAKRPPHCATATSFSPS